MKSIDDKTLDDITDGCNGKWCILKEIVKHTGLDNRMGEQVRLIYDYKFIESSIQKKDIGLERATMEFTDRYAKKFADIYKEGMHYDELKYKLFVEDNEGFKF